jgi:hypothetical protein
MQGKMMFPFGYIIPSPQFHVFQTIEYRSAESFGFNLFLGVYIVPDYSPAFELNLVGQPEEYKFLCHHRFRSRFILICLACLPVKSNPDGLSGSMVSH